MSNLSSRTGKWAVRKYGSRTKAKKALMASGCTLGLMKTEVVSVKGEKPKCKRPRPQPRQYSGRR